MSVTRGSPAASVNLDAPALNRCLQVVDLPRIVRYADEQSVTHREGTLTKGKRPYLIAAASAAIVAAAALAPAAGSYAATSTSGTTVSQLTVNGTTTLVS
jgi:hypothetical protein